VLYALIDMFDANLLPSEVRFISAGLGPCAVEALTPRSKRFRYGQILQCPLCRDGIGFFSGPAIYSFYQVGLTLKFTTLPKTVRPSSALRIPDRIWDFRRWPHRKGSIRRCLNVSNE